MKHPAFPYIAPFVTFLFFLAIKGYLPFEYYIRVLVVCAIVVLFSRKVVTWRSIRPLGSILVGILVFVIWIGPDLISITYRQHWLFHNFLIGSAQSTLPESSRTDYIFLLFRIFGTAVLVPIIEELFWRGWLMRYLISPDFLKIRLGSYSTLSFWLTAFLFATEHGPYWDVGLFAGIIYGWWMIRTRSLGDCILAHGITNALLAAHVIAAGQWQYWL
jgi:CAAX prenyl protease-like protein